MAQTFLARVTALAGAPTSATDLDTWLTNEARMIVDLLPEAELDKFKDNLTIDDAGTDVSNYRVISADKDGYPARVVPYADYARAQDPNSFRYATLKDPAIMFNGKKVYKLPANTTGFRVQVVAYPTVQNEDSSVATLPVKYEELLVLGASVQNQQKKLETLRGTLPAVPDVSAQLALMLGYITTDEDFEKSRAMGEEITINLSQYLQAVQGARTNMEMIIGTLAGLRTRYSELYGMLFGKGKTDASR